MVFLLLAAMAREHTQSRSKKFAPRFLPLQSQGMSCAQGAKIFSRNGRSLHVRTPKTIKNDESPSN